MPLETLSPDAVFQATHLIVFLPPCLGAFVLSNHSSHNPAFFKYSPSDTQTDEGPTACVKQVANFPLPSLLPNQNETLQTARFAAADGYLSAFTIPLLAEPETLIQTARLNWVLRFPLPPPNPRSNRRFSRLLRPIIMAQALDAAIRYAAHFTYDDPPPTHPLTCLYATPGPCHSVWRHQTPNYRTPLPSSSRCSKLAEQFGCTHRRNINFLEPTLLLSPPSLKIISLATSVWTNSSRYLPLSLWYPGFADRGPAI